MTQHGRRPSSSLPASGATPRMPGRLSAVARDMDAMQRGFTVCPECGNQRYPLASDHTFKCTDRMSQANSEAGTSAMSNIKIEHAADDKKTGMTVGDVSAFAQNALNHNIDPRTPVKVTTGFRQQIQKLEAGGSR